MSDIAWWSHIEEHMRSIREVIHGKHGHGDAEWFDELLIAKQNRDTMQSILNMAWKRADTDTKGLPGFRLVEMLVVLPSGA